MSGAFSPVEFEIEDTFAIKDRGVFVGARLLAADRNFVLPDSPALGGARIARWLEIPRKLDADGKQRLDYFVFKLLSPADRETLRRGQRVLLEAI